ncbi:uncharacterized protein LOC134694097 [Mytilus trossulus]|uniref:uncharacterized protein LOC134694097 n=1 Tax=Mytilus trossulus TaxID=6551 RepID=UPI003004C0BA
MNLFDNLTALSSLWLDNNKITTVEVHLFRGLTALSKLNLRHNRITTLDINLFNNLTALSGLDLGQNQITTLDINLFDKLTALSSLYLDNNPLDCSTCELKKLKKLLRKMTNSTASCDHTPLIDHIFTNCTESVTTEAFQSSVVTDSSERTTESSSDIRKTEVIVYLSCGVGFFFILSFSMACFYVVKKYRNNQNLGINQINLDSETQRSPTISSERGSGYGYAEIDELEMSEFILTPSEQLHLVQDDSSNDSYDQISPPSNDLLNPYESLLTSLQQSGNDQDDSDEYSHPNEENRAYDNLYQPIRFNRQDEFRQYASCSSVHYFEVLDEPEGKENDARIREDSKRLRKTW